jgi:clan AA aspartic protease
MAIDSWCGSILNDGTPVLSINISGPRATSRFDAIVDTGFSGFLSIPQRDADKLGIIPQMTERVFFADNSSHIRWTSIATISVGDERQQGVVYLEPASEEVLIGVEFISKFQRMLLFYPSAQFVSHAGKFEAEELLNRFRS